MVSRIVPTRYNALPTRRYGAKRSSHAKSAHTAKPPQASAVPKSAAMKAGVTAATLMACMAATPCAGCSRARAFITKPENAKKTPAIIAQPKAAKRVNTKSKPSIIRGAQSFLKSPGSDVGDGRVPRVVGEGQKLGSGQFVELARVPVLR